MPDTAAQTTTWDLDTRSVVADNSVLDVLSDGRGAGLDGGKKAALGVDERRRPLAWHHRLGLHRHLGLRVERTRPVLPLGGDEEARDGDEERVVHRMPILALRLLLDNKLAVLAPVRVLAELARRQVLAELTLRGLHLLVVEAMGDPATLRNLVGVEGVDEGACNGRLARPKLIVLGNLLAQPLGPEARKAAALALAIEALLCRLVAKACRADEGITN
eukprot:1238028-Prymnesium_polylepis.2